MFLIVKILLPNQKSDFISKRDMILVIISFRKFVIIVIRLLMHPWDSYSYNCFQNLVILFLARISFKEIEKVNVLTHNKHKATLRQFVPWFSSSENWLQENTFWNAKFLILYFYKVLSKMLNLLHLRKILSRMC